MEQWELIICFTDNSWNTEYVEVEQAHIDGEADVHNSFLDEYRKNMKKGDKDIAYVGTYHIDYCIDE